MQENEDLLKGSATEHAEPITDRSLERLAEDRTWVPVIVKRTDEARRHPDDVLMAVIEEGLEQLSRPTFSLGLSAVAAGLILGFTAMAVAVVSVAAQPFADWPMLERLAVALVYPLGFVVCLMSGAELYTEHTAIAGAVEIFAAVLASDEFGGFEVARFLSPALLGNLIGGSFFVAALNYAHIRKSREMPTS
jgi:formate/nitrite transporter FocA (FNT family)